MCCTSKHVIYVIHCARCDKQGVGEWKWPLQRLQVYLKCLKEQRLDAQSRSLEICRHFMESPRDLTDLVITLVDKIPPTCTMREAVKPAIRTRLEAVWINKLQAELNTKRHWRSSFPGWAASRNAPNDSQALSPQTVTSSLTQSV